MPKFIVPALLILFFFSAGYFNSGLAKESEKPGLQIEEPESEIHKSGWPGDISSKPKKEAQKPDTDIQKPEVDIQKPETKVQKPRDKVQKSKDFGGADFPALLTTIILRMAEEQKSSERGSVEPKPVVRKPEQLKPELKRPGK